MRRRTGASEKSVESVLTPEKNAESMAGRSTEKDGFWTGICGADSLVSYIQYRQMDASVRSLAELVITPDELSVFVQHKERLA